MAATQEQINQFNGLINSGNYSAAADLGRATGYSDADISAYVGNMGAGISSQQAANYLSSYPGPSSSTAQPATTSVASTTSASNPYLTPDWVKNHSASEVAAKAAESGASNADIAKAYNTDVGTVNQYVYDPSHGLINNAAPGSVNYYFDENGVMRSTTVPVPKYTFDPSNYSATTVDPASLKTITPFDYQKSVADVVSDNGQILQAARGQALMAGNARGLINSSITTGAADLAALQQAQNIASATGNFQTNADTFNANANNNSVTFNATANNQLTQQLVSSLASLSGQQLSVDAQKSLSEFDAQTKTRLQEMQSNTSTKNQATQSVASLDNNVTLKIAEILNDPNLTTETKQANVNAVIDQRNETVQSLSAIAEITIPLLSHMTVSGNSATPDVKKTVSANQQDNG